METVFTAELLRDFLSHLFSAGVVVAMFIAWIKNMGSKIDRIDDNVKHMRDQHDVKDSSGRPLWYQDDRVFDILFKLTQLNERQLEIMQAISQVQSYQTEQLKRIEDQN